MKRLALIALLVACGGHGTVAPDAGKAPVKYGSLITPGIGTISGVTAGSGLTGGGAFGTVALNVGAGSGITVAADTVSADTTYLQRRVTGTCTSGNAIQTVSADGTVTCQAVGGAGTITGVTAGTDLTGGGTSGAVTLNVNTSALQARVTGTCTGPNAIDTINSDGTVTCSTNAQQRVTGTCSAGNAIGTINADGTVVCNSAGAGTVTSIGCGAALSCSPATPITSSGTINLAINPTSCGAGTHISAIDSSGNGTCTADTGGGITGTGTAGDLMKWSTSTAATNFGGSTPSACAAGSLTSQPALSAAGVLANNCSTLATVANASGGGSTTNFLRGDGTWATPPGTGVTGSGTAGKIPKWATNTSLGDSDIDLDNGTSVGFFTGGAEGAYITQNSLNFGYSYAANGLTSKINATGASGSTAFNRNLEIDNGKGAAILTLTGSTLGAEFAGALTVDGNTTLGTSSSNTVETKGPLTVDAQPKCAGGTPTVSAGSVAGTNCGGTITTGVGTTETITWTAGYWSHTPPCVFIMASGTDTTAIYITSQSTISTAIKFPNSLGAAQTINYNCGFNY